VEKLLDMNLLPYDQKNIKFPQLYKRKKLYLILIANDGYLTVEFIVYLTVQNLLKKFIMFVLSVK
jgi:hypothetical protein